MPNNTLNIPFAPGIHLLIDLYGASHLDDIDYIENTLRTAATACGVTVLSVHLHSFGSQSGVTGVAILAESHITIHTWPEINFVALDIFLCGNRDPNLAVPVFEQSFAPQDIVLIASTRGKERIAEKI